LQVKIFIKKFMRKLKRLRSWFIITNAFDLRSLFLPHTLNASPPTQ
jgi:hypothetical protein